MAIYRTWLEMRHALKRSRDAKKKGDLLPLVRAVESDNKTCIPAHRVQSPHRVLVTIDEINDENLLWYIHWLKLVVAPINRLIDFLETRYYERVMGTGAGSSAGGAGAGSGAGVGPATHTDDDSRPSVSMH